MARRKWNFTGFWVNQLYHAFRTMVLAVVSFMEISTTSIISALKCSLRGCLLRSKYKEGTALDAHNFNICGYQTKLTYPEGRRAQFHPSEACQNNSSLAASSNAMAVVKTPGAKRVEVKHPPDPGLQSPTADAANVRRPPYPLVPFLDGPQALQ
ncbi:jg9484 [Pararge aegeria aegeria]|uniref:Jg9484 protein n=1 Tax=Pararge aegeria aegeria TaxID=348720 RepID=A0A8S4RLT7_9NEOP|nr:jg9484 [Pararge aegeria aegeria]